jgi:hypothetical protein
MFQVLNSVTYKESSSLIFRDENDFQSGGCNLSEGKPREDKGKQNTLVRLAENRRKLGSGLP